MRHSICLFAQMLIFASLLLGAAGNTSAAEPPSPKLALSFQPVQKKWVEYETPAEDEYAKCQVKVERRGKASGWVVYGPEGQLLRRFSDTDGDNVVDQWQYFNQGIEVYRDLDSNNNNKVDQSRWLNTAGTRWGLDKNEDGQIDSWKMISPEEAGRLAVESMIAGDVKTLETVLIAPGDIKTLGIEEDVAKQLLGAVDSPAAKMRKITGISKVLNSRTKWMRFDSASPGVIPQDEGKASADLIVYENAMGIVDNNQRAGLIQLGEMVRVGDAWKLTQIPQPLEGENPQVAATGILIQPASGISAPVSAGVPSDISPEARKLLEQLQKLDSDAPSPAAGPKALADYNRKRADLLEELAGLARTDAEREQWTKQLIDGLTAAVQTGQFPDGLARLKKIEADAKKQKNNDEMLAYVGYRR